MDHNSYKTINTNTATAEKNWVLVDAEGQILGRIASQVAKIIRGKNKPGYTPNTDCGDHVIVINAEKVKLTGKKETNRVLFTYSGYPGGLRERTLGEIMSYKPTEVVEHAIKGMLPKNRRGKAIAANLHLYADAEYKQTTQQPTEIKL